MAMLVRELENEGIAQRQLERDWGVSQSTISDWKSGKRNASARTAEKVARKLNLSPSYFNDPRLGDDISYRDFQGKRGETIDFVVEPAEFLEWEKAVGPFVTPSLQPHERRQMVSVRFHRGQLEKYSRLLQDLRDGLSPEEILAEEADTASAEAEAVALGIPRRAR